MRWCEFSWRFQLPVHVLLHAGCDRIFGFPVAFQSEAMPPLGLAANMPFIPRQLAGRAFGDY
jgi:hypothetical protein